MTANNHFLHNLSNRERSRIKNILISKGFAISNRKDKDITFIKKNHKKMDYVAIFIS